MQTELTTETFWQTRHKGWLLLVVFCFHGITAVWLCRAFVLEGNWLLSPEVLDMSLPWTEQAAEAGSSLAKLLWDSKTSSGMPFMANPAVRVWYPPELVLRVVGMAPEAIYSWLIFFHLWLLGVGGSLWLSDRLEGLLARLLSGWVWMVNGYVLSRVGVADPSFLYALAWLPWIFVCLRHPNTLKAACALVPLMVCQTLAGRPDITYYAILLIGCWWMAREIQRVWSKPAGLALATKTFSRLVLAAVLTVLVCAIQLLATLELQAHSSGRSGKRDFEFTTVDSMQPHQMLMALFPHVLGDPRTDNEDIRKGFPGNYWGAGAGVHEVYWYVGQTVLVLAVLGLLCFRGRERWFWAVVLALAGVLALGRHSVFYRWCFDLIPGWSSFRVPARVLVWCLPAVSYLAGVGFQTLQERRKSDRWRLQAVLSGYLAGLVVLVAAVLWWQSSLQEVLQRQFFSGGAQGTGPVQPMIAELLHERLLGVYGVVFRQSAIGAAFALLGIGWASGRKLPGWLLVAVLVITMYDGITANDGFIKGVTRSELADAYPRQDPLLAAFQKETMRGRLLVTGDVQAYWRRPLHPWFFPGRLVHYPLEQAGGYGPFQLRQYLDVFRRVAGKQSIFAKGILFYLMDLRSLVPDWFAMLNVSHVISAGPAPPGFEQLAQHTYTGPDGPGSTLTLYRSTACHPRFFVTSAEFGTAPPQPIESSAVSVIALPDRSTPNQIGVQISAPQSCRLVRLTNAYPGWKAIRNGEPVEVGEIAGTFQAVDLPAGDSTVIFFYDPWWWQTGWWCLLTGLVGWLVWCWICWKPARGRIREPNSPD